MSDLAKGMNVRLSLSLYQTARCALPLSFGISFGASPRGIFCSAFFPNHPSCSALCIRHAVSFSHQRHLFPLIPHPLLFPPTKLCAALICSSTPLSAFHLPSLYHTLFHIIVFNSSLHPFYHCIHFILLFLLTSSLGIFYHFSPSFLLHHY